LAVRELTVALIARVVSSHVTGKHAAVRRVHVAGHLQRPRVL
jgi:hypothetical protein